MLFDRLFRSRPVQPEMRVLDRKILGHEPAIEYGAVIAYAKPTAIMRGIVLKRRGIFQ